MVCLMFVCVRPAVEAVEAVFVFWLLSLFVVFAGTRVRV